MPAPHTHNTHTRSQEEWDEWYRLHPEEAELAAAYYDDSGTPEDQQAAVSLDAPPPRRTDAIVSARS